MLTTIFNISLKKGARIAKGFTVVASLLFTTLSGANTEPPAKTAPNANSVPEKSTLSDMDTSDTKTAAEHTTPLSAKPKTDSKTPAENEPKTKTKTKTKIKSETQNTSLPQSKQTAPAPSCMANCLAAANITAENQVKKAEEITTAHGFSLYGDLKYPADATHLDYANPAAPKGGTLQLMATGTFDTLNPYILKGLSPWSSQNTRQHSDTHGFGQLHDSLMAGTNPLRPSGDEPQSAYGLVASELSYPPDLRWTIFHIRPEAQFHDGHPITAEDVAFSLTLLKGTGHPTYAVPLLGIARATALTPNCVKFDFKKPGQRHIVLRAGAMPILPKHTLITGDFRATGLTPILGSGPYRVQQTKPGQQIILERVEHYWGKDLWLNRGLYNFDTVIVDFYRDLGTAFDAFKAGRYDVHLEYISSNWVQNYDFRALDTREIIKAEVPHKQAQNTQAFFFNTRQEKFQDRRVREAIALLFDFEWSNEQLFSNAYRRSNTFFPNTPFAATDLPSESEKALLMPFKTRLAKPLFDTVFTLPTTDGTNNLEKETKKALALFEEAGYVKRGKYLMNMKTNEYFRFEMLTQVSPSIKRIVEPFKESLERAGIIMTLTMLDAMQYKDRMDKFDFDMTIHTLIQSLAPGDTPYLYFHSTLAQEQGSHNIAGIQHPAVDALVAQLKTLENYDDVITTMRALDRILLWEYYTIPHWHIDYHRLAWWDHLAQPSVRPDYILGTQTWWQKQVANNEDNTTADMASEIKEKNTTTPTDATQRNEDTKDSEEAQKQTVDEKNQSSESVAESSTEPDSKPASKPGAKLDKAETHNKETPNVIRSYQDTNDEEIF